jgi:hypothetical protein
LGEVERPQATSSSRLHQRAQLYAEDARVWGRPTRIGVNADVQNVWSAGAVDLANAAKVHGFVLSSGAVTSQPDTVVTGGIQQYGSLGQLQHISWSVTFPTGSLPSASLEPGVVPRTT